MAKVEIYSTNYCPFCTRAKTLFDKLEQPYEEINIEENPKKREEMMQRASGGRTVPQIFINGHHVGGSDDLMQLHIEGKLKELLG